MHSLQKYIKHKYTHLTFFLSLLFFMIFESREDIIKKILSFSLDEVLPFLMFAFFSVFISITIKEKIAKKYPETNDGITIIALIFGVTLYSVFILYYLYGDVYQSTIALLISSVLLGSGWWVQATVSKVAARKSHTLNTLMNQRNSELFHKKVSSVANAFGLRKTINEIIVKQRLVPNDKDLKNKKVHDEYISAGNDMFFVLNYYEFICSGIINGDFDEDSMRECLGQIVPGLEVRAFHFIRIAREISGSSCFCNFVAVSDKWSTNGGSLILRHEKGEPVINNLTHCFEETACYNTTS